MGAKCELCKETGIDPEVVCRRPDTPLVQGRWQYEGLETEGKLVEKMEKCPIYMLFRGAGEIEETSEVIKLKSFVKEIALAKLI